MGKLDKSIERILARNTVSYADAEKILLKLGFDFRVRGSHFVFGKSGYPNNVTLKKRSQLLPYQINMLVEVLKDHGY